MVLLVNHSQGQKQHKLTLSRREELSVDPRHLTLTEKQQQDELPCSSSLLGCSKLLLPLRQLIG